MVTESGHRYTRRDFLRMTGIGLTTMMLHSLGCRNYDITAIDQPNIILIMADDLGYEGLSCYGSTSYQTPNLDELARTGLRFVHAYSQPLCTPSRVQIMTGRYNHRNYQVFGVLDPQEKTFGHILQDAGYATCVVGKWQLKSNMGHPRAGYEGTHPYDAGFDNYCLWQISKAGDRYADPMLEHDGGGLVVYAGEYGPDIFVEYLGNFMEQHKSEPFFAYYPMTLPHKPFVPTPDSDDWLKDRDREDGKYFGDMVAYMDKLVGRIVEMVDALGLRERTLILFTTDNGTHGSITSQMNDGTEITGGKGFTTDAGTRAALIANWPGVIPEGHVIDDLVDFSDFLPTLAEISGAQLPDVILDGQSFAPQLRGEKGSPRDWIYCYYAGRPNTNASPSEYARDKRWKLYGNGKLFDISNDVLEKAPIAIDSRAIEALQAREKLQAVLKSMKQ